MIRFLRHSLALISLLLLLALGLLRGRVIWWSYATDLPRYRLASVTNSGLTLAFYEETRGSDARRRVYAYEEALIRAEEFLPQQKKLLEKLIEEKADPVQISHARALVAQYEHLLPRRQAALMSERAYQLPSQTGLHFASVGVRTTTPSPIIPSIKIVQRSDGDNLIDCIRPTPGDSTKSFLGVSASQAANGYAHWRRLFIPFYLLIPPLLFFPCLWLLQIVRARRRVQSGFCKSCGYDLRASPERCPECGSPTQPAAAHAV